MSYNGIDVSSCNGTINWQAVKNSGMKFAIIRECYGNLCSQKDTQFERNINGALANGLKVGIYHFSYAISVDDAVKEAEICNQIIAPYKSKIAIGVFFDWEYDSANYFKRTKGYSASNILINQMNVAFMQKMKSFGYKSGTYFNGDYKNNILNQSTLNVGYKWFAYYSGLFNGYDIQQTSSTGHVNGVSGNVDIDICYNSNLIQESATQWKSDTTGSMPLMPLGEYQLKITANGYPDFKVGNSKFLTTSFVNQQADNYYFKIKSTGVIGNVGLYVGNTKFCVVNIGYLPFKSDTTTDVSITKNKNYTAKITCQQKPAVCCGTSNVLQIDFVRQIGQDWYYKFTAIGNVGQASGIYINGQKQPTFIGKVV